MITKIIMIVIILTIFSNFNNLLLIRKLRDWPLCFWRGGGGGEKFWNKLFAEAVNTEINCMQVKKQYLQEERDTKPIFCSRSRKKKCFHVKIFEPSAPRQKNNGPSLTIKSCLQLISLKKYQPKQYIYNSFHLKNNSFRFLI